MMLAKQKENIVMYYVHVPIFYNEYNYYIRQNVLIKIKISKNIIKLCYMHVPISQKEHRYSVSLTFTNKNTSAQRSG